MSEGVQILQPVSGALSPTTNLQDMLASNAPIEIIHASPETIAAMIPKSEAEDEQSVVAHAEALIAQSTASGTPTLQSLLAAPVTNNQIQIITVASPSELLSSNQVDGIDKVWQVVPSSVNPEVATIIAVNANDFEVKGDVADVEQLENTDNESNEVSIGLNGSESTMMLVSPVPQPSPQPCHTLPPNCPSWAARLKNCQVIGNSYRGYVDSEAEVDLLLTYHKQETHSFWGTRQSPSPAKPSTRLMWKSQYVPFDGIPFINSGSRAIVMECQFGPRRKGNLNKKQQEETLKKTEYRQTCPARIYIKKVKKFPDFAVDMTLDKKSLKISMDKSFQDLKSADLAIGQERYYVQLPTENAHQFHGEMPYELSSSPQHESEGLSNDGSSSSQLDPRVHNKIRSLVAAGETRVYAIRKQLRNFVTKELYPSNESCPERHDLTLFPTVNDLKNRIHQAFKDLESGKLARVFPSPLKLEVIDNELSSSQNDERSCDLSQLDTSNIWQIAGPTTSSTSTTSSAGAVPETVTVTLTQNAGEDGQHVISRIETHLSDGTTQVSTTLTPETAQLLSKLHPGLISTGNFMQLPAVQPNLVSSEAVASNNSTLEEETQMDVDTSNQHETEMVVPHPSLEQDSVTTLQIMSAGSSEYLQTANGTHQIVETAQLVDSGHLVTSDASQIVQGTHILQADSTTIVQANNVQLLPSGMAAQIIAAENGDATGQQLITVAVNPGELVQISNEPPSPSTGKV